MRDVLRRVRDIAIGAAVVCAPMGQLFMGQAIAVPTGLPAGFSATTLQNYGLGTPTSVRIAPDGRIFVVDLLGSIKLFTPGSGLSATAFGTVSVDATGDRGLLGAAFDSDFANNPYLYIHYVGTDDKVRIGRFNANGNTGTNFQVLYTAPTASGFQHAGGGITVDNNGYVYFGIGDSGNPPNGQDLTTVNGKIHRINRDGTVPVNPFAGQANVPATIYDYGVRNPFRMQTDRQTGTVYVGDVGFNTWEEVNVISAGKNYGWPAQEGPCTSACAYENPVYWYQHQFGTNNTNDASIVLGPVYRGNAYPASYKGRMFVSDYVQGFMRTINPSVASSAYTMLATGNGPVIDMDVGPDGKLYFVTISGATLYRLDYTSGTVNQPPTAQAAANVATGPVPLAVNFSSAGSTDPENSAVSYQWDFGDGTSSTQANPSKTYSNNGQYTVHLTVSDGVNSTPSNALTIRVGAQPIVSFSAPNPAVLIKGNDVVNYTATATEANGTPIPNANLQTTINLYHSDHNHPFMGPLTGGSGSFTVPTSGELSPDIWYRITVTATGAGGVTGSSYVEVFPQKAMITVNTNPAGLNVMLDGSNHVIPPTVQGVTGLVRSVSAPSPQLFNGKQYVFDHWSDGGAQTHEFPFPAVDTTLTAYYVEATGGTQLQNILANPSFESLSSNLPVSWAFNTWGTNDAMWQSSTDAVDGQRSVVLSANSLQSGEGTLSHTAITVAPATTHNVRYRYKSNVQLKSVADVTLTNNTHQYIWLGITQPSATWNEQNWTFVTPASASKVVVTTTLTTAGSATIDDFAVLAPTAAPPAVIAPVVQLSATPSAVTAGQSSSLAWSVSGTSPSCTGSGGWNGSLPTSGNQMVTPSATASYTLTCTNSMGTDSKSATITVLPIPPVSTNILANPSFEDDNPATHLPLNWQQVRWGTNNGTHELVHGSAFDADHHVRTFMTSFSNGEAGWKSVSQPVTPGATYTFSQYALTTGPTKVLAEVQLSNGQKQYLWLGALPQSTTWQKFTKNVIMPSNAQTIAIGTYLTGIGDVSVDFVDLSPAGSSSGTAPTITITASPSSIGTGQSAVVSWSVSGANPTCTASGGWNGSQPVSGSLNVSPASATTYTLVCGNLYGIDTKSVTVTVNAPPSAVNLIANPSLAVSTLGATIPTGWYTGSYGTNSTQFQYQTTGRTDGRSIATTISGYTNGDAKWFFEPVAVTAGQTYQYSYWRQSTASSEVLIGYDQANGTRTYEWRGIVPAAANWTQATLTITPPTGTTKVTVYHILKSNGMLQLDDFSLSP